MKRIWLRFPLRTAVVAGMCLPSILAPQAFIAPIKPSGPVIVKSYEAVTIPPTRLQNSPRLAHLVRAGALYLTERDAIALALENNIDLEVSRYDPIIARWNVERSEAGGALPGATYQQGFLTGGNITAAFTENYLKENAPTDLLNPSSAVRLSISAQQNLLRGFGIAINARTITVSKMSVRTSSASTMVWLPTTRI